jgi:hypothetical protein
MAESKITYVQCDGLVSINMENIELQAKNHGKIDVAKISLCVELFANLRKLILSDLCF